MKPVYPIYKVTLLSKTIPFLFGLLVPGWGSVLKNQYKFAFSFLFVLIGILLIAGYFRWVTYSWFLNASFVTYIAFVIITSLASTFIPIRPAINNKKLKTAIIGLYPVFIIFVFSILFFYKSIILGFDIYYIPTHSMKPTLSPGDFVLVNTWIYKHKKPSKKDIVLFVRNNDWDHILIKRIVAESSESIIYNDDTIVEVKKTAGSDALNSVTADGSQIVIRNVPEDYVFVVGDNYRHSQDSRHFGAIRISTIIAKALYTVEIHSEDVYSLRLFHLKAM